MDILPFVKPLKVILTELFVLIQQNWNFKRKCNYKQSKYKIIHSLDCCLFAAYIRRVGEGLLRARISNSILGFSLFEICFSTAGLMLHFVLSLWRRLLRSYDC